MAPNEVSRTAPRIPPLAIMLAMVITLLAAANAQAAQVRAAVATNFSGAMAALAVAFAEQGPHRVVVSSAASGKLFAQIQHGAPVDVFFSADRDKIERLRIAGALAPGSDFIYAHGRLALWWPRTEDPLAALNQLAFAKLSVANPGLAPYGVAALATLEGLGLRARVESRLVMGDNIGQTLQFVGSGNATLGFVALAQLAQPPRNFPAGRHWLVPEHSHPPIEQAAARLARAREPAAADAFLAFVKSPQGRAIIERYGYRVPAHQP